MTFYYEITEIKLIILGRKENINPFWEKFKAKSVDSTHFVIELKKNVSEKYGLESYSFDFSPNNVIRCQSDIMLTNLSWTVAYILPLNDPTNFNALSNQLFYTHAVQRHMVQIHSSMIDYQGKGILFLGPSGIGKTTMAELWSKYRNALIINGDMNFVQETDECFLGWGTPWHGSSPYCENTNVPVHALIVLKQASENSIRELKNFEKVQSVSNNIIYPTWLENGMELCLETLDHLLTALPVYELSCRPDEDAVRLTEEKIFGNL